MKKTEKSKYSWALVGVRPKNSEIFDEEEMKKMIEESFLPNKTFQLFLCGAVIDKTGTLNEMESGLDLIRKNMNDYHEGDYCIISSHDRASLLFLPIMEKDLKND